MKVEGGGAGDHDVGSSSAWTNEQLIQWAASQVPSARLPSDQRKLLSKPTSVRAAASSETAKHIEYLRQLREAFERSGVRHARNNPHGAASLSAQQDERLAAAAADLNKQLEQDRLRRIAVNRHADLKRSATEAASIPAPTSGLKRARAGDGSAGAAAAFDASFAFDDDELDFEMAVCVALASTMSVVGAGGERNYYAALGLTAGTPQDAVRRRWHALSRLLHPDRVSRGVRSDDVDIGARAEEAFKIVARAYEELSLRF